jgi:hypothetical protein
LSATPHSSQPTRINLPYQSSKQQTQSGDIGNKDLHTAHIISFASIAFTTIGFIAISTITKQKPVITPAPEVSIIAISRRSTVDKSKTASLSAQPAKSHHQSFRIPKKHRIPHF